MNISESNIQKLFTTLATIPSPSRNERQVADYIITFLENLGYEVVEDNAGNKISGNCGNLIVNVPPTAPGAKLLLSAHMDTVETGEVTIEPIVGEDGNIRSAGDTIVAADDKTGVTCILELLRLIAKNNIPHGGLVVILTVAEEKETIGARQIDPDVYLGCDAGIVLDHSMPNQIIVGAPSKIAIHITVNGVGGHAAFPERCINAAHVLARTVSRLPSKRLDEFSTANLGIVKSGTAINVIPGKAYAEYELRSHQEDLLDFHLSRVLTTIESSVRESSIFISDRKASGIGSDAEYENPVRKATVEVDIISCYEAYKLADDCAPVILLKRAIESSGLPFEAVSAQGGSDANAFNAYGLPSAVLGCGMHGVHSTCERASIPEMTNCLRVLLHLVSNGTAENE